MKEIFRKTVKNSVLGAHAAVSVAAEVLDLFVHQVRPGQVGIHVVKGVPLREPLSAGRHVSRSLILPVTLEGSLALLVGENTERFTRARLYYAVQADKVHRLFESPYAHESADGALTVSRQMASSHLAGHLTRLRGERQRDDDPQFYKGYDLLASSEQFAFLERMNVGIAAQFEWRYPGVFTNVEYRIRPPMPSE